MTILPTSENWIQTYSRHIFRPLGEFDSGIIDIRDIAHALSMQCRYNGHCERFYSVAEHSVLCARYIRDPRYRFEALMHDATEAYICDIPTPIKKVLPGYYAVEERLERRISQVFDLQHPLPISVKEIDFQMLSDEVADNMKEPPKEWMEMPEPIGVEFQYWTPEQAEKEFMEAFEILYEERLLMVA